MFEKNNEPLQEAETPMLPSCQLEEQQKIVHENLNALHSKGMLAGKGLAIIKKQKLYRNYESSTKTTWNQYCSLEFGITPQYANRLIRAYECFERVESFFRDNDRLDEFQKLPENTDLFEQLSKFKAEKQGETLVMLIDKCKECNKKIGAIRATDLKELQPKSKEASSESNYEALALDAYSSISSNQNLLDRIAELSASEMRLFAKALQVKINGGEEIDEHR